MNNDVTPSQKRCDQHDRVERPGVQDVVHSRADDDERRHAQAEAARNIRPLVTSGHDVGPRGRGRRRWRRRGGGGKERMVDLTWCMPFVRLCCDSVTN